MAGQGTVGIELMEDVPDLDLVLCPVGGGGLLCGTAIAVKTIRPNTKVIATEPAGADDAAESFRRGELVYQEKKNTIADGLLANLGAINFALVQRYVDDVVTVGDESIVAAMRTIWETMKIVIEPSAAVPYAGVLEEGIYLRGKRAGLIVTGGNVDLDVLPWIK
jgi:threonine dehydratase